MGEKLICNNKTLNGELEESIIQLNEQRENNEIEQTLINQNLVEIKNEIIKLQDQITLNNSEEYTWKKKLEESENMRCSIYEYFTEIKSQLVQEKEKITKIDNEISINQC